MIVVMVAISVSLVLTYSFLRTQTTVLEISRNTARRDLAFQAAQTGAAVALSVMESPEWEGVETELSRVAHSDPLGTASYVVEFHPWTGGDEQTVPEDSALYVVVHSIGTWESAENEAEPVQRHVEVVVKLKPRVRGRTIHAGDSATAEMLPASAKPFYAEFASLTGELTELDSPAEIIDTVLKRFYDDYLVSHYDGASLRKEDINGLANFAAQYNTLEAFLADITLAGEFSGETVVTGPTEQEFVVLSTIHQAKGLEWPVVFIPWLADGRFPTDFCLNTQDDEEEERRVFHVAVTRAKDELYLVAPQVYRNRGGGLIMMKPSRFLTEIAGGLTEAMELDEGLPHLIGGEDEDLREIEPTEHEGKKLLKD